MTTEKIPYLCRVTTTWDEYGAFDPVAYGEYLERFVPSDIGVLMAGPGEGRGLSLDELGEVYRAGVACCRGRIPIGASGIEEPTAAATITRAQVAVDAGVDIVGIYGLAGAHGYRPNDEEYLAYWDAVLKEIRHPVAIGPNPANGYSVKAEVVAEICNRHSQITTAVLAGINDDMYFLDLRDRLTRDVEIYIGWHGALEPLSVGVTGLVGQQAELLPKTMRQFLDLFQRGEFAAASQIYYALRRYERVSGFGHGGQSIRATNMAIKAFRLPGHGGGMREPWILPGDKEIERYVSQLLDLGIPEIDELAVAAGYDVPNAAKRRQ